MEWQEPFLGVTRSITGRRWQLRHRIPTGTTEELSQILSQRLQLPDIVARIMAQRGISLEGASQFLTPTLRDCLPDPFHLKDMDLAANRLCHAIKNNEKIAIFGDYDVDGATSSALLQRFFTSVGGDAISYIPDRQKEGYGPNIEALLSLQQQGAKVVVTVDCGITSFDALAAAKKHGLDVIIIDHHGAQATLPEAVAIVNPNRQDETSPCTYLAAVGVSFFLAIAVNKTLRESGWYKDQPEPNLMQWLDLVALGTVCDVVPMIGVNRALVYQGLKVMRQTSNVGIQALMQATGILNPQVSDTYHLGFVFGPRVNAGGRVGESSLGVRLLTTQDWSEAQSIAERLNIHNNERKIIEQLMLKQALEDGERDADHYKNLILMGNKSWHPGVIGIIASRLVERFHKPAIIMSINEDGMAKGSGRSTPGIHLGQAITAAYQSGLLVNGGGHAMAAGLTVEATKIDDLQKFLEDHIANQLNFQDIVPLHEVDGSLSVGAANLDLWQKIQVLSPFGTDHPEPRFVFPNVEVVYADVVGEGHVRCTLQDENYRTIKAMAFKAAQNPLGQALLNGRHQGTRHVTGVLRVNHWQGQDHLQLHINDVAMTESAQTS